MVRRCSRCDTHVEWMWTRYGRRLPFELPIPITDPRAEDGWVPGQWYVRGVKRVVLFPLDDSSATRRANIRHVVLPHRCDAHLADMFTQVMSYTAGARVNA